MGSVLHVTRSLLVFYSHFYVIFVGMLKYIILMIMKILIMTIGIIISIKCIL